MPPKEKVLVEVEKIYDHCDSTKSFYLKFVDGKKIDYQAGQFVIGHFPKTEAVVKRAYSIASAPHETQQTGFLEICLNRVEMGYVSNWLHDHNEGTQFYIDGPHGNFMVGNPPLRDLIFCATGTGIAPIRGNIADLEYKNYLKDREIWLFYGVRYETDILYHPEFLALAEKYPNFHYLPTISRPKDWKGEVGYVQVKLKERITDPARWDVFACGLTNMIKDLEKTLQSMGFQKDQLHYDKWG